MFPELTWMVLEHSPRLSLKCCKCDGEAVARFRIGNGPRDTADLCQKHLNKVKRRHAKLRKKFYEDAMDGKLTDGIVRIVG
jgi:hypothetical protein